MAEWYASIIAALHDSRRDDLIDSARCPGGMALKISTNAAELDAIYTTRLSDLGKPRPDACTIYSIVTESSEIRLPRWADFSLEPKAFHTRLRDQGILAAYPYQSERWQALDLNRRVGIQLIRSVGDLPPWDFGSPLRQHLHWLSKARGSRLTHGATLAAEGRGVLFLGNSGSGKSGITLAGLAAGLQTTGDDYVCLSAADEVTASCLYTIIKQDQPGIARVPEIARRCAHLRPNWKGKLEISQDELPDGAFVPAIDIRAVVLPVISTNDRPQIRPCGHGEVLRALMRSNLYQFPGEEEDGMAFFANVVRRLPAYRLLLSGRHQDNGDIMQEFIASL